MTEEIKLSQNLSIKSGQIFNYDYDPEGLMYPIMYELLFDFHGKEYAGHFSPTHLRESKNFRFASLTGDSELFDSFMEQIEDGRYFEQISSYCKAIWEGEDEEYTAVYDYTGEKSK